MHEVPSRAFRFAAIAGLLFSPATPSGADDATVDSREPPHSLTREILLSLDGPETGIRWIPANLYLDIDSGLVYKRKFEFRDRKMKIRLEGPALSTKALGLTFEIKF